MKLLKNIVGILVFVVCVYFLVGWTYDVGIVMSLQRLGVALVLGFLFVVVFILMFIFGT